MDYLARETAPFDASFWNKIDSAIVDTARKHLVGRKFLDIYGPLGAGASSVSYDKTVEEEFEDGIVKTVGRSFVEIPQLYHDFSILWRDIEQSAMSGYPLDISAVRGAAHALANKEDSLIFFGSKYLKSEGIMNAAGAKKIKLGDWGTGETAFKQVVEGVSHMSQNGITGRYVLCVSPAIYVELQRIQPGTGMLEIDRISKQLFGLFNVPIFKGRQAVLMSAEPQYMDLALGVDMAAGYLELKDFNHSFRIVETVMPRIKKGEAVVVYE